MIKIGSKWIVGFDKPAIERELARIDRLSPTAPAALLRQCAPVLSGIAAAGPHTGLQDANELSASDRYRVVFSYIDSVP